MVTKLLRTLLQRQGGLEVRLFKHCRGPWTPKWARKGLSVALKQAFSSSLERRGLQVGSKQAAGGLEVSFFEPFRAPWPPKGLPEPNGTRATRVRSSRQVYLKLLLMISTSIVCVFIVRGCFWWLFRFWELRGLPGGGSGPRNPPLKGWFINMSWTLRNSPGGLSPPQGPPPLQKKY